MKTVFERETKYYKYVYSTWTQPTLTSNGSFGGNSMAVDFYWNGYNSKWGNYTCMYPNTGRVGFYCDEWKSWMKVFIYYPKPVRLTNISFRVPTVDAGSGAAFNITLYGGNGKDDNSTTIKKIGNIWDNNNYSSELTNSGYFQYYTFYFENEGAAYADRVDIENLKLTGVARDTVAGTASDYDYKIEGGKTYMVDVRQSNTNCLTSIPNDVKLELNNGTLTLKAGSKVYNANGLLVETMSDTTKNWGTNTGSGFVFAYPNGQVDLNSAGSETVSSLPAPARTYKIFFNTTDGKCYFDANTTQMAEISFPIARFSATNGITSIDQVFNGFGYIGNTLFGLPDVKGLIPNGKNADGSNNCTEASLSSVQTVTYSTWTRANQPLFLRNNALEITSTANGRYYPYRDGNVQDTLAYVTYLNNQENKMYHSAATAGSYSQVPWFFFGYVTLTNGVISNMRIQSVQPETIPCYKAFNI